MIGESLRNVELVRNGTLSIDFQFLMLAIARPTFAMRPVYGKDQNRSASDDLADYTVRP